MLFDKIIPGLILAAITGTVWTFFFKPDLFVSVAMYEALLLTIVVFGVFMICVGAEIGRDHKIFKGKNPMHSFAMIFLYWTGSVLCLGFLSYLVARTQ
ncbi:MAG TPA: hypothetical protein PKD57_15095 [Saprospiraceae bacterium]|nr:hypothetical protein [Saprospiraceae bacterium]HNG59641.1 hypothetical protein [Cellvibrionaceae bacterium]